MRTIHKYEITITERQDVAMPQGAELLSVQLQRNVLCVWARVDTDHPVEQRTIFIVGTGRQLSPMEACCRFLGTVQMANGNLVWHVFDGDRA